MQLEPIKSRLPKQQAKELCEKAHRPQPNKNKNTTKHAQHTTIRPETEDK